MAWVSVYALNNLISACYSVDEVCDENACPAVGWQVGLQLFKLGSDHWLEQLDIVHKPLKDFVLQRVVDCLTLNGVVLQGKFELRFFF